MKTSHLWKAIGGLALVLLLSFSSQAQTVTFHNFTDCNLVIEVGYQNSADPPCTLNTTTLTIPCGMVIPWTLPAGNDVFKGYRVDPSGDLTTGINVVYHCGTYTPSGCATVTVVNPVGCGNCSTATQTCWRNTTLGTPITGNYDVGFF